MFRKARLICVVALVAGGSFSLAADPVEVVNKFLNSTSSVVEESEPLRDVVPQKLIDLKLPKTTEKLSMRDERPSVRTAQKPKSVLRLSEELIDDESATLGDDDEAARVEREVKRMESSVERKMQGLERSLKREEKRLESRLEDLGERRQRALSKGDIETLKRIERSEKQAVIEYDKRIQRLLSSASRIQPAPIEEAIGSKVSSVSGRSGTRKRSSVSSMLKKSVPSWNRTKPTPAARPKSSPIRKVAPTPKPQPQKRRFKLWPFR